MEDKAKANNPHKDAYVGVWDLKHTTYSDQTGCFPYILYRGNKYIMVMADGGDKFVYNVSRANET